MPKNDYKKITKGTKYLIEGPEGKEIDFKSQLNGVKPEDFVAFANSNGGIILIGVEEKKDSQGVQFGNIVGCPISDKAKQTLINIAASCRPSIEIVIVTENTGTKKPIIRIEVPSGKEKPYCTSSGVYKIRSEGQNIAIDPPLLKAIILEKSSEEFISRFKSAGEEIINRIDQVQSDLAAQINRVEMAASEAIQAATAAEEAARDAEQAAYDAGEWAAGSR